MSETVMSRIIRQAIVSASEVEPWPDLNPRMAFDEAERAELERAREARQHLEQRMAEALRTAEL